MKFEMHHFLKRLFVWVCLLPPAFTMSAEDGELPSIEFRTLGLTRGIQTDLYYYTEEGFEKLPMAYFRPSQSMTGTVIEDGNLPLFRQITDPEGEIQYVIDRTVVVANRSSQILLLGAHSEEELTLNAVRDNLSGNHLDWLFINITGMPIAVQLGDQNEPVGVGPGRSVFHKANLEADTGAAIRVAVFKEEGWIPIYSRFWPIYSNQRSMVVFIEVGGEVRVHNFFEAVKRP